MKIKKIKKIIFLFVIFLVSSGAAQACKFIPREYSQIYKESDNVFVGKIVGQKKMENGKFTFDVVETLKGKVPTGTVVVTDPMLGTSCQKGSYEIGKF